MIPNWPLIGSNLAELLVSTAVVAGIAYPIRRAVAGRSPRDAYVGWFAYGFAVANFFGWGIPGLNTPPGMYRSVFSMFGLLFGLILGNILGAFLWRHYRRPALEAERKERDVARRA